MKAKNHNGVEKTYRRKLEPNRKHHRKSIVNDYDDYKPLATLLHISYFKPFQRILYLSLYIHILFRFIKSLLYSVSI